jgi:hypothetical protein
VCVQPCGRVGVHVGAKADEQQAHGQQRLKVEERTLQKEETYNTHRRATKARARSENRAEMESNTQRMTQTGREHAMQLKISVSEVTVAQHVAARAPRLILALPACELTRSSMAAREGGRTHSKQKSKREN